MYIKTRPETDDWNSPHRCWWAQRDAVGCRSLSGTQSAPPPALTDHCLFFARPRPPVASPSLSESPWGADRDRMEKHWSDRCGWLFDKFNLMWMHLKSKDFECFRKTSLMLTKAAFLFDQKYTKNSYNFMYAFSRRFYPKWLTVRLGYKFFCQYVCSLGIEPITFTLLTQCSTRKVILWNIIDMAKQPLIQSSVSQGLYCHF